jgi:hypothetical protein
MGEKRPIPILAGVFTDAVPDVRTAYPVNLVAVAGDNGVSGGYLRPHDGIVSQGTGSAVTRGLYAWSEKNTLFYVAGTEFGSQAADGTRTVLGTVAAGGPVTMVNSFERLAIASGGRLYYWDLSTLTEVTDARLGVCLDIEWLGGYFVSTDGEFIVTTSLLDPTVIRPFDYANPESSPDPLVALLRTRNEINALGRVTIEVFSNVGGSDFPLATIPGAQVQRGVIGTHACCLFLDRIAFLGSGPNEAPAIYLAAGGSTEKISTDEIEYLLATIPETQLADVVVESRIDAAHQYLYIHLPDRTMLFDFTASSHLGQPVWSTLSSALSETPSTFRARYFTWCYDRWNVADPTTGIYGHLDGSIGSHWGDAVRCEVSTNMIFTGGVGGVINMLELVGLPGRCAVTADPRISTSYSTNGRTWSLDESISAGMVGDDRKRLQWRRQGRWSNYRIQRFRWTSEANLSVMRLVATLTPLEH